MQYTTIYMQYYQRNKTTTLGDIDGDGFDDLAVGSPYEDNGAGAVRIYYGKKRLSGIQDSLQVSQKRILRFFSFFGFHSTS